ncbi:hypothetical protein D3C76_1710870 [compost metagenome]
MGTTAKKGHDWSASRSGRSLFHVPSIVLGFVSCGNFGLQPGFHLDHNVISSGLSGVTILDGPGKRGIFHSELGEARAGYVEPLAKGGLTDQPFA